MAKEDARFDTEMRRVVRRWFSPNGSWDMTCALAKPAYVYITALINKQKERAFDYQILKNEYAVIVAPYDQETLDDIISPKPVCLSDILVWHGQDCEDPQAFFDAVATSVERARKKLKRKGIV
jgi:hypothetical protein